MRVAASLPHVAETTFSPIKAPSTRTLHTTLTLVTIEGSIKTKASGSPKPQVASIATQAAWVAASAASAAGVDAGWAFVSQDVATPHRSLSSSYKESPSRVADIGDSIMPALSMPGAQVP